MIGAADQSTADIMERRLLAWGAWKVAGSTAGGYPTRNVLDLSWTPPAPGMRPSMRVAVHSDVQERDLDGRVQALSVKLRDAVFLRYCKRMDEQPMAEMLGCQASTVRARIAEAKRQLAVRS